jgi:hypothetical protein
MARDGRHLTGGRVRCGLNEKGVQYCGSTAHPYRLMQLSPEDAKRERQYEALSPLTSPSLFTFCPRILERTCTARRVARLGQPLLTSNA